MRTPSREEVIAEVFNGPKHWSTNRDRWLKSVNLLLSKVKAHEYPRSIVNQVLDIAKSAANRLEYSDKTLVLASIRDALSYQHERESIIKIADYLIELASQAGDGAEQVNLSNISISQALDKLSSEGMSDETRQRVETEIRYGHKPLWNVPREEQLPDLRGMTAMEHLRKVWDSEIERWGNKVYLRTVRTRDPDLAETITKYASKRKSREQDRGAAKGLMFVKGFEPAANQPTRPKPSRPSQFRKAGMPS